MSHAFELAIAHSTLKRSLKSEKKDKKKTPWEVLKRKDKKTTESPVPKPRGTAVSPTPPTSKETKSNNRKSNYLNPPPPVAPGYSPEPDRRVASTGRKIVLLSMEGLCVYVYLVCVYVYVCMCVCVCVYML